MEIQVEIQVKKQELYSEPARPFGRDGAQPVSNFHDCGIARVSKKSETVVFRNTGFCYMVQERPLGSRQNCCVEAIITKKYNTAAGA